MSNITIKLFGGSPWGFRMMGGSEFNLPLTVENVSLNGKAMKHGLMMGDIIISCNGVSFEKISHAVAKSNISSAKDELILYVYRKSGTNSPEPASIPVVATKNNYPEPKDTGSKGKCLLNLCAFIVIMPTTTSVSMTSINKETTKSPTVTPSANTSQVSVHSSTASQTSTPPPSTTLPTSIYPQPKNRQSAESSSPSQKSSTIVIQNPKVPPKFFQDPFAIPPNTDNIKYKEAPPSTYTDPFKNTGKISIVSTKGNPVGLIENKVVRICSYCNEDIGILAYVKLGERFWHSDHFFCNKCKKNLVGVGFFEDGPRMLCKECYGEEKGPKCTACGKPCITEYLTAANNPYHAACFICTNCKRSLRGCPFNIHNGTPHCMDCVTKLCSQQCCRCDKGIIPGEEYIEASGKLYHENCFVCTICSQPLAGKHKYTIKNGEPCCPEHY